MCWEIPNSEFSIACMACTPYVRGTRGCIYIICRRGFEEKDICTFTNDMPFDIAEMTTVSHRGCHNYEQAPRIPEEQRTHRVIEDLYNGLDPQRQTMASVVALETDPTESSPVEDQYLMTAARPHVTGLRTLPPLPSSAHHPQTPNPALDNVAQPAAVLNLEDRRVIAQRVAQQTSMDQSFGRAMHLGNQLRDHLLSIPRNHLRGMAAVPSTPEPLRTAARRIIVDMVDVNEVDGPLTSNQIQTIEYSRVPRHSVRRAENRHTADGQPQNGRQAPPRVTDTRTLSGLGPPTGQQRHQRQRHGPPLDQPNGSGQRSHHPNVHQSRGRVVSAHSGDSDYMSAELVEDALGTDGRPVTISQARAVIAAGGAIVLDDGRMYRGPISNDGSIGPQLFE